MRKWRLIGIGIVAVLGLALLAGCTPDYCQQFCPPPAGTDELAQQIADLVSGLLQLGR